MWIIDSANSHIDKQLRKYRSNRILIKQYMRAIDMLANADDPAKLGSRKKGRLHLCHSYTLTKSYRLLYRVIYETNTIELVGLGDHKQVFGQD